MGYPIFMFSGHGCVFCLGGTLVGVGLRETTGKPTILEGAPRQKNTSRPHHTPWVSIDSTPGPPEESIHLPTEEPGEGLKVTWLNGDGLYGG